MPAAAPVQLHWGERRTETVDGVDVHVESRIRPGGPLLVGLHGFASGTFTWAALAEALPPEVGLLAWDRPPFGRSARPRPVPGGPDPYTATAEARRLASLLAPHVDDVGPVVLVGHSQGALLACEALLAGRPGGALGTDLPRIDGLVLVAPAMDATPPPLVARLGSLPGTSTVVPAILKVAVRGTERFLTASGRHRTPWTDATAAETGRLLRRRGTAAALWHLTVTWEAPTTLERLGDLDIASLVIGGADDRIVSEATHRATAAGLGTEAVLLDGVGHVAHEQAPDVVADLLAGFLGTLGRQHGDDGASRDPR